MLFLKTIVAIAVVVAFAHILWGIFLNWPPDDWV